MKTIDIDELLKKYNYYYLYHPHMVKTGEFVLSIFERYRKEESKIGTSYIRPEGKVEHYKWNEKKCTFEVYSYQYYYIQSNVGPDAHADTNSEDIKESLTKNYRKGNNNLNPKYVTINEPYELLKKFTKCVINPTPPELPEPPKPIETACGSTPASDILLLAVPELSMDYSNTWRFENQKEQQKYFLSKQQKAFEKYSYLRKDNAIKVQCYIDDIHSSNYVMYKNKADKWYYCFITNKEYINENTTKIYIKTDVIQTYQFDFTLAHSYVDRCHVHRWDRSGNILPEIEPEELEFGEYVQEESIDICNFENSFVAVCSNPLGVIKNRPTPGTGGHDCGDWEKGILSPKGFRFIKGFEAFAPVHYLDTIANPPVNTLAYGVTEHGEKAIYDQLVAKEPVQEEEGAKISYDLKNNNYGKRIVNVCKAIGVTKQYQFDALVSLAFNAGVGAVTEQGSLMQLIKKDPTDCAAIKAKWETYYNAAQIEGVRLRRIEEAKLFCGEEPEIRKISIVDDKGKPSGKYVTENNGNGWLPKCDEETKPVHGKFKAHGYDWVVPVETGKYQITAAFPKYPKGGWHGGTDIGTPTGAKVFATRDGEVVHVEKKTSSYGYHIIIQHDGGLRSWYAHNSELLVSKGDKVKQGQLIAKSGATGNVTGPHLHYELRKDPYRYGDGLGNNTDCITPIPNVEVGDTI